MKGTMFTITRADGRSNAQVLCDFVGQNDAGSVISYDDLSDVLSVGSTKQFGLKDVQSVVNRAGSIIGRVHKRTFHNVRGVGYRVAKAEEHLGISEERRSKASRQLKRGFEIMRDLRLDEIKDPEVRKFCEAQAMVFSGLCYAVASHEKRLRRIENVIDRSIES